MYVPSKVAVFSAEPTLSGLTVLSQPRITRTNVQPWLLHSLQPRAVLFLQLPGWALLQSHSALFQTVVSSRTNMVMLMP